MTTGTTAKGAPTRNYKNLGHAVYKRVVLYCDWRMWYIFFSLDLTKPKKPKNCGKLASPMQRLILLVLVLVLVTVTSKYS